MAYVCNLLFFEAATFATSASGPLVADGEIHAVAQDGGGLTVKYNLNADFNYSTGTNTTGVFLSLIPGTYTVYARSNSSCLKTLQLKVDYVLTYVAKYRIQHGTVTNGPQIRFDIEDYQFSGSVQYVEGTADPTNLAWRNEGGQDIFYPVLSSQFTVELNSPSDDFYSDLVSFEENRFRGTFYVDGVQKWQGFLIPMNTAEPYVSKRNYQISLCFTDGLTDLDKVTFSDDSGNFPVARVSILQAIVWCLNKTGLRLLIHDSVNFYETSQAHSVSDSTLRLTYFDPEVYKNGDDIETADAVLKSLLFNLCARVLQTDGHWTIEHPPLSTSSATPTRILSSEGGYISNSNLDNRILLRNASALAPKLTLSEQSGVKEIIPMYGRITFTYDFGVETKNNLLVTGDFEDEDEDNGQFNGWQVDNSFPALLPDGSRLHAQVVKDDTGTDHGQVLKLPFLLTAGIAAEERYIVSSATVPINIVTGTRMKLSFDVYTRPSNRDTYAFIDMSWSVTGGAPDDYILGPLLNEDFSTNKFQSADFANSLVDIEYLRTYIDSHYEWKTITFETVFTEAASLSGDMQIKIRVNANPLYDYVSISALRTDEPDTFHVKTHDNRRRVYDSTLDAIRHYKLRAGFDSDDNDKIIVPDNIAAYVWELDKIVSSLVTEGFPAVESWLNNVLLDNVQVQYLPQSADPQPSEEVDVVINDKIKNKFENTFRHGDLPADTNYKFIAHGWLSRYDGVNNDTPTALWTFRDIGGIGPIHHTQSYSLMGIIQYLYRAQYGFKRWKLSGSLDCAGVFPYAGFPIYEVRTGKIYVIVSGGISFKMSEANLEFVEALQGSPQTDGGGPAPNPDIEPPVSLADFDSDDFDSTDFLTV